ncbi:actinodefensin-associated protein B [Streptomyces griseocarneus]|uniref:actinodefensin-associated protein B n=1 Tax=Streptomyces griseocarneus TaxID=51201 RepID=UPI00167F1BD4|nr:actinodefensin-associated protein B [Streptomyces griseocarneus]MBZ6476398.1 actinodefensin-associated protein B [Streptomyces griseocarneus]GHG79164.1 hypothetical protein GCM10018779_59820 [Streptomyces griseocarneus]
MTGGPVSRPAGSPLRLAPHVTYTSLPHGGGVLVNGVTLEVAECGEYHSRIIDRLLVRGMPDPQDIPAARAVCEELIHGGWLTVSLPDL